MIDAADPDHCRAAIRAGSLSFHTASRLLPARVRDPALALYAFCRLADDAVDEGHDKTRAVLSLRERLDLVYAGTPRNAAADRAFAAVVQISGCPSRCSRPCWRGWLGMPPGGAMRRFRGCWTMPRGWPRRWGR